MWHLYLEDMPPFVRDPVDGRGLFGGATAEFDAVVASTDEGLHTIDP